MPLTIESAFDVVGAWLSQPAVVAVEPTAQHLRFLRDLLLPFGTEI
ncbi:MAG: hypothetical protein ABSH32_35950 [Bryobacteraceae bacterium]|jgi:hypothetical protein